MGMYSDYYKKYYSNIDMNNSSKEYIPRGYYNNSKAKAPTKAIGSFPVFLNIFGKRYMNIFIAQCILTLILLGGLIFCRLYPTTEIGKIYTEGLSYMSMNLEIKDISKEDVVSVFNNFKGMLDFNEKKELYINENYMYPVQDQKESSYWIEDNSLMIKTTGSKDIRASFPGKVKDVTDGVVRINYGEGVEMVYNGLSDIKAVEGMELDSKDIIGKTNTDLGGVISIEILYMGERLNPSNCFNLDKTI